MIRLPPAGATDCFIPISVQSTRQWSNPQLEQIASLLPIGYVAVVLPPFMYHEFIVRTPPTARYLVDELATAGYECYLLPGLVKMALMCCPNGDESPMVIQSSNKPPPMTERELHEYDNYDGNGATPWSSDD